MYLDNWKGRKGGGGTHSLAIEGSGKSDEGTYTVVLFIYKYTLCFSHIKDVRPLYSHLILPVHNHSYLHKIQYTFTCLSRFIVFVSIYALHTYFIGMKLTTCPLLPFRPNFYYSHITPFIQQPLASTSY